MSKARDLADLGAVTSRLDTVGASDGALSNRNLIINGAMQVAQRGTSFTALANAQYCLDRWRVTHITDGVADVKQTSDGPVSNVDDVTFTKCLHVDVTTADTSVSASNMYAIIQGIEDINISHVGFGKSGTRYVTASFWVKSTKTGTFCCFIKSSDSARAHTKEYTISSSNTWEYKTLTFPIDTSGSSSWPYNSVGAELGWTLYGGTNYHITADTWTATTNNYAPCTSNQVNAFDSASNDFKITGVQLEVGDTATPFEHRSYGDELARCQRYYQIGTYYFSGQNNDTARNSTESCEFRTKMRSSPTITNTNTNQSNVALADSNGQDEYRVQFRWRSSGTSDFGNQWNWTADAEL